MHAFSPPLLATFHCCRSHCCLTLQQALMLVSTLVALCGSDRNGSFASRINRSRPRVGGREKGSRERMRATHTGGGKNKSVPKPHNGWVNIYTKKFTQVIGRHANTHTRIPHRKHVHSARKNCNNKLSATVEVRTPRFVPHSHAGVPVFDADTCVPALQVPRRNTPWGFLQHC